MSRRPFEIGKQVAKTRGKTVIAHLSDLHFTSRTDSNEPTWQALINDLRLNQVDVLIVTGDLVDGSFRDSLKKATVSLALDKAYRFLVDEVCNDPQVQLDPSQSLLVIPGNHDYRVKGLFANQVHRELFCNKFKQQFLHKLFPNLKLCCFVFDSNGDDDSVNFAAGIVDPRDIVSFDGLIQEIRTQHADLWCSSTRVSLLHHHPMPLAPTEERSAIADREEFLLLTNAGQFMTEMVRTEIDLVLHGHQHYPGFSRASFPRSDSTEHMISVVAAGSVGKKGPIAKSYNLITIDERGEITLQRRSCPAVTYESSLDGYGVIRSYEQGRRIKWLRLANEQNSTIHATKLVRSVFIMSGSGDARIKETFDGLTSFSKKPISEWENVITSQSGFVSERSYECMTKGQEVTWEPPDNKVGRSAVTRFSPPLGHIPISIVRNTLICNAFHFSQRDRLDATNQENSQEEASLRVSQACESFVHQLAFPQNCFPSQLELRVLDAQKERDRSEEAFLRPNFDEFVESRTAVLRIDHPLPGYTYEIAWRLPQDDPEETLLRAPEAGYVGDFVAALLRLRSQNGRAAAITEALRALNAEIRQAPRFRSPTGEDELEIAIFCYDRDAQGLLCTAALNLPATSRVWQWVVKPGLAIVGQAYRRREALSYVQVDDTSLSVASPYYQRFPESVKHTVVFCVPIFYPLTRGRRVCVVSIASRSMTSGLLCLDADVAARLALAEAVTEWFWKSCPQALALGPQPTVSC